MENIEIHDPTKEFFWCIEPWNGLQDYVIIIEMLSCYMDYRKTAMIFIHQCKPALASIAGL